MMSHIKKIPVIKGGILMNALEEKKRYFATKNNRPSTFQEYLEYWFWEVFFPKCTSRSVQMKNFWIIYYVIRPQTLPDCPLDKLDQHYLDTLLENCQKYCQCAGYTVYKCKQVEKCL